VCGLSSEQGTIVDRIDYNITNVAASVEQGVKELVKVWQMLPMIDFHMHQSKFLCLSVTCLWSPFTSGPLTLGIPLTGWMQAEETQKKGGMVTCIMVLIALCAIMLFVYIIKKIIGLW
jgi:syntaxin 16